jgi:hypothetical protein
VVIRDNTPVADSQELTRSVLLGTFFPLRSVDDTGWTAEVAIAGKNRQASVATTRLTRENAAPHPLPFSAATVTAIGNELMGQPYGWGELFDLRDCSAMLRDFFSPFGIWLPRSSTDQIASLPKQEKIDGLTPDGKMTALREKGKPFLTLIHKQGHIMLYVGLDGDGKPLAFQNLWSIRLNGPAGTERVRIVGQAVITTLEPGKELGLAPGRSLLEQITAFGTLTDRCVDPLSIRQ